MKNMELKKKKRSDDMRSDDDQVYGVHVNELTDLDIEEGRKSNQSHLGKTTTWFWNDTLE